MDCFFRQQRYQSSWCFPFSLAINSYTVSQKVSTFILSVTLSNPNRFSHIFCIAGKRMKFATKPIRHYKPHFRCVTTLPWEIKYSNLWLPVNCVCVSQRLTAYSVDIMFCPEFLRKSVCQPLCCVPLPIQTFIKILSSLLNTVLIVDKHCSDIIIFGATN